MAAPDGIAPREAAAPSRSASFDVTADIVVVGGGGGGLPTALFSRWLDNEVVLLEKAPELGGTAKKAAFWYWVPNNAGLRSLGMEDRKEDCLRYMARLSRPTLYDPDHPRFGLTEWEYSVCEAIYESASEAAELLKEKDALPYVHAAEVPDYWAEIPEDATPKGRVLYPLGASESMSDGGQVAIRNMGRAAERDGVDIRTGHRVQRLITSDRGEVVGVEATTPAGEPVRVQARKAVVFATGGFTHNEELRRNFLNVPVFGGCAALSNEGDFVSIATAVGGQLRNMNYAWMCPVPLEHAVQKRPDMSGMFSVAGDSMLWVNRQGVRVVNEKLAYNELAQVFFTWDPNEAAYPNLVLIAIWDQRAAEHSASDEYGRLIPPPDGRDDHVIRGDTWDELAAGIADRLHHYRGVTGGMTLADDFAANLPATVAQFNEYARAGVDEDFHRGERAVQQLFNGPVKEEDGIENPTMYPLSETGPYYAALVTGGTLDTKGGPKATPDGQIVDDQDRPIPGLYGVGNCVASPSAQAYWSGGATLGPIIALAHRAARAADREPVKEPTGATTSA
ncbi:MAG TPA: FAD-dependent oxidoreductase [Acidimicrobiales bacterium]